MPNTTTNNNVDPIISAINALSNNDRQALTEKVRTTPSGISAFRAFNFGAGSPATTSTTSGGTNTGTSNDSGTSTGTSTGNEAPADENPVDAARTA